MGADNDSKSGVPDYFAAIQALLLNQQSSGEDFLLFLTTRIGDKSTSADSLEALVKLTRQMHDGCSSYSSEFAEAGEMI
jgi:hypothetical protein